MSFETRVIVTSNFKCVFSAQFETIELEEFCTRIGAMFNEHYNTDKYKFIPDDAHESGIKMIQAPTFQLCALFNAQYMTALSDSVTLCDQILLQL